MKNFIHIHRGNIVTAYTAREPRRESDIEVTPEQLAVIQELRDKKQPPIWYDGRITSVLHERENGTRLTSTADGYVPVLPPVPTQISAWQAKAALAMVPHPKAGTMLAAAEAAISSMSDGPEKTVVLSAWTHNANFQRTSPTILNFGAALGMSSADLDNLFRLGGGLVV